MFVVQLAGDPHRQGRLVLINLIKASPEHPLHPVLAESNYAPTVQITCTIRRPLAGDPARASMTML